jgi:hypothetical protein
LISPYGEINLWNVPLLREQPDDTLRPIFTEADNLLRQAGGDSEARAIGPVLLLTAADVPAMPP